MSGSTTTPQPSANLNSLFIKQINNPRPTTPLFQMFLSPDNVAHVANQIAIRLQGLTGKEFHVPVNEELQLAMQNVLQNNYGMWASAPQQGLQILNHQVIESETQIQLMSYRQHQLYDKYFITQNREKVFPYGAYDRPTKGEQLLDTSIYQLSNPHRQQYPGFLKMFGACNDYLYQQNGDWAAARAAVNSGSMNPAQIEAVYQYRFPGNQPPQPRNQ